MDKLTRLLLGKIEFTFKGGFTEGFLNDCLNNGIDIRHIVKISDGLYAVCSIKTYKSLHRIAYKNAGKVHIISKSGLPFVLYEWKGRLGFACGICAFLLLVSFLSGFVWNIEYVGFDNVDCGAVSEFVNENGLYEGALWSSFDKDSLAYSIMASFDDTSWVHINKIGTTARVEINERTEPPSQKTEKEKGSFSVSRKEIALTVNRNVSESVLKYEKKYKSIYFYSLTIPLYIKRSRGVTSSKTDYLTVNGKKLPIALTEYTEKFYDKKEYILNDEQLKVLAKNELRKERDSQFDDNVQIVNENIDIKIVGDACNITGSYIVRDKNIWRKEHRSY